MGRLEHSHKHRKRDSAAAKFPTASQAVTSVHKMYCFTRNANCFPIGWNFPLIYTFFLVSENYFGILVQLFL